MSGGMGGSMSESVFRVHIRVRVCIQGQSQSQGPYQGPCQSQSPYQGPGSMTEKKKERI